MSKQQQQLVDRWKQLQTVDDSGWVVKAEKDRRLAAGILTADRVDSDGEVLDQPSAYQGTLDWIERGGTPIAYMHDISGSLGHAFEAVPMRRTREKSLWIPADKLEEIQGTRIAAEISKDYGFGSMLFGRIEVNDIWQMLKQKAISGWSIHIRGYEAGEDEMTGAPRIVTQRVVESSIVTVPAHVDARAGVERMLKAFGIQRNCKNCQQTIHKGLERLDHLSPEQWGYVVEHCREHGQDEKPEDLSVLAGSFVDLAKMLRK